jgi:hypothetical protein
MKISFMKNLCMLLLIFVLSMGMVSCESDDDDIDGLIYNQTPHRVQVNFLGIKVVELTPGLLLGESALDKGSTYLFQVTVFESSGNVLEVIDSALVIDDNTGDREINNQTASWFIRISGDNPPFNVVSAS